MVNKVLNNGVTQTPYHARTENAQTSQVQNTSQESWLYWLASRTAGIFWTIFSSAPTYVNLEDDNEQSTTNSSSSSATGSKKTPIVATAKLAPDFITKLNAVVGGGTQPPPKAATKPSTKTVSAGPPPPPPPLKNSGSTSTDESSTSESPSITERPKLSFLAEIQGLNQVAAHTPTLKVEEVIKKAAASKKEAPPNEEPVVEERPQQVDPHLSELEKAVLGRKASSEAKSKGSGSHLIGKRTSSTEITTRAPSLSQSSGSLPKPAEFAKGTLNKSTSEVRPSSGSSTNGNRTSTTATTVTTMGTVRSQSPSSVPQPGELQQTGLKKSNSEVRPSESSTNGSHVSATAPSVATKGTAHSQSPGSAPQPAGLPQTGLKKSTSEVRPSGSSTNGSHVSTAATTLATTGTARSQSPGSAPQLAGLPQTGLKKSTSDIKLTSESSTNGSHTPTTTTQTVKTLGVQATARSLSSGSVAQPIAAKSVKQLINDANSKK